MRFAQNNKLQTACYVGESWVPFRGCTVRDKALITDQDTQIWLSLVERGNWNFLLPSRYMAADRRDADLMLQIQRYLLTHGSREYVLALGEIYCAGALQAFSGLDDLLEGLVW